MKIKKSIKKIIAVGFIGLVGMGALVGCTQDPEFTQADVNAAYKKGKASVEPEIKEMIKEVEVEKEVIKYVDADSNLTCITADQIIEEAREIEVDIDAKTKVEGYVLDELQIGAELNPVTLSDRDIALFDGELDFDGDDYDAEEIFNLTNYKIAANEEEDWNTDTFLQLLPDGISYVLEFASNLNTSLINNEDEGYEDETLIFDLLGEEVEVDEWDDNEVTFTKGEEENFIEGQEKIIDNRTIKVSIIHDNYVKVYVDGVGKKIYEGSTKTVNGIDIKVIEVSENDETSDETLLYIGEEVEVTIKDGEEYEDDSIWEWIITPNSIGLKLVEEFTSIDEDEDFKALAVGEEICLPNDYVCIVYDGLNVEDTEDYDFEIKQKGGESYVMVKGEFIDGINDYDKIYIKSDGKILDEDLEMIGDSIELADTDLTLETELTGEGVSITIESDTDVLVETDFELTKLGVDKIEDNLTDIKSKDEDYITNYGIVIKNPEDNLKDNELQIEIPEEQLEASIVITSK